MISSLLAFGDEYPITTTPGRTCESLRTTASRTLLVADRRPSRTRARISAAAKSLSFLATPRRAYRYWIDPGASNFTLNNLVSGASGCLKAVGVFLSALSQLPKYLLNARNARAWSKFPEIATVALSAVKKRSLANRT